MYKWGSDISSLYKGCDLITCMHNSTEAFVSWYQNLILGMTFPGITFEGIFFKKSVWIVFLVPGIFYFKNLQFPKYPYGVT